jgi:hypothetical protein
MDTNFRDSFIAKWRKYFGLASLPIVFEYTDDERHVQAAVPSAETRCLIAALNRVREGHSLSFSSKNIGCSGGGYYSGLRERIRTDINQFLSCGVEGKLEGERYKKTPEIAGLSIGQIPWYPAPAEYLVFKRWDKLEAIDNPEVVIFYATPDVLAGLYTLAGFDEPDVFGAIITPFGAGCGTIIKYPYLEQQTDHPRAVLGMFDVSARPYVFSRELSFAVPMKKFITMVNNMDESFLITHSWEVVKKRMENEE